MREFSKRDVLDVVGDALGAADVAVVVADTVYVHEAQGRSYVEACLIAFHDALANALDPLPEVAVLTLALQTLEGAQGLPPEGEDDEPEAEDVDPPRERLITPGSYRRPRQRSGLTAEQ